MLAALVILSWSSSGCGGTSVVAPGSTPAIAPRVGALAPDFTLPTLSGEAVMLSELRGQPVFLQFWGTWCVYCRWQMPFIQAAFEEKGQEIAFIAIDVGESSGRVEQYVDDSGIGFTVVLDRDKAVAGEYNIRYYPTMVFIDEHGVIKHIRLGAFMDSAELMAAIEILLA
jgi:thiol-disulfide isomerase/thioredoxin